MSGSKDLQTLDVKSLTPHQVHTVNSYLCLLLWPNAASMPCCKFYLFVFTIVPYAKVHYVNVDFAWPVIHQSRMLQLYCGWGEKGWGWWHLKWRHLLGNVFGMKSIVQRRVINETKELKRNISAKYREAVYSVWGLHVWQCTCVCICW